ncbi:MAG: ATP-binding protein [Pyrinomonadaceae bacterium]
MGANNGYGPFVQPNPNVSLLLLISFVGLTSLMTLVIGAVTSERRKAEADKDKFGSELAHESTAGRVGGLAIVRHLVELHGGTVSASNRDENGGAVLTVSLPALEPAPPRQLKRVSS